MRSNFVIMLIVILIYGLAFGASMRSKDDDDSKKSSMRPKGEKKESEVKTSSMRPKVIKYTINWQFRKGDVNPTVNFYDVSDGMKVIVSDVKLKGDMSVSTECTKDHEICYGGNFELVGKKFIAGCGAGCSDLNKLDSGWRNDSCNVCDNVTASKPTKVRQDRREVKMTWRFSKGDVNPSITFYNNTEGNKAITGEIKLKGEVSVPVMCMENDLICYGGNFDLAGKSFVAGCGAGCSDMSERDDACQPCKETTVSRSTKVRKK